MRTKLAYSERDFPQFAAYAPPHTSRNVLYPPISLKTLRWPVRRVPWLGCSLLLLLVGCSDGEQPVDAYPRRPIKLIVPFAAGGGSDTFGRVIQNAIETHRLLPERLVIINVPGAGGTIGSRRVKHARPDGYTLLLLHEGMLTARHSGSAGYGPEAFVPIAGTGNATQVVAVSDDSPYSDLPSLMREASRNPDSIVFSANIGAPSHFAGLMLQSKRPGSKFRYTQTGGGAKRFAALQGGHADVSSFSIAEYVQFKPSGIRALALLGPERHPDLPGLATAIEQGFDVESQNMQFWWAPLGTPPDRVETIADALAAAMQTEEVRETLAEMKITETVLRGAALDAELQRRERRIAEVAPSAGVELPDFAMIALGCLTLTAVAALIRANRRRRSGVPRPAVDRTERETSAQTSQLAAIGCITIGYVITLQFQLVRFVPVTAVYALLIGGILLWPLIQSRRLNAAKATIALLVVSVLMSVVMHHLFTEVLVVDLP
ncbi:tripartite tricarboxylate transporter substrate binding protein [Stieleria sp. ICT_E10.1]|uniref:tripartite tricarboxylate transporter substrate binding protein n=1 Tax=Stieleria sedimenti TaxID=2976331 RepID=UPI0021801405|nr:tripartite tricarboxylate transporter substrate binding protein [Stieleria sedimenti]MCS7467113.1 tripartite tricarboxylate transporter substrate binding protein [Stieleria sedimenti]